MMDHVAELLASLPQDTNENQDEENGDIDDNFDPADSDEEEMDTQWDKNSVPLQGLLKNYQKWNTWMLSWWNDFISEEEMDTQRRAIESWTRWNFIMI